MVPRMPTPAPITWISSTWLTVWVEPRVIHDSGNTVTRWNSA